MHVVQLRVSPTRFRFNHRYRGDLLRMSRRRLRVLTLLDTLRPGGAERLAVTIAARLDPRRFESTVCVSRRLPWSPLSELLEQSGVPVVTLNRTHRGAVWSWAPLVAMLRRRRIDVLHAHMFGSNVWGTIVGRAAGVPIVVAHEHGSRVEGRGFRSAVDRELVARAADVLIAVSESDRRRLIDVEGVSSAKVRIVRNGIPPLPAPRVDLRRELRVPYGAPVIGALTVLRPEKGLDVLVEAVPRPERADRGDWPRGAAPAPARRRARA